MKDNQKKIQALIFKQNEWSAKRKALLDQLWVLEQEGEDFRREQIHLVDECLRGKQ